MGKKHAGYEPLVASRKSNPDTDLAFNHVHKRARKQGLEIVFDPAQHK
jgi:hypothetical protein